LKSDRSTVPALAARLFGSPDIYGHEEREPEQSVNFVTCHDGFTLNDVVSFNHKHNEDNGEGNLDGMNDNLSWNCGVEGATNDPEIETLRRRQIKNHLALMLLAFGTPMILMGDEMRRSQLGNNNAYCQDNETSWLDWRLESQNADIVRFAKMMIAFRNRREVAVEDARLSLNQLLAGAQLKWHGVKLDHPDWGNDSHSLAFTVASLRGTFSLHVMLNAYWETLKFELPAAREGSEHSWQRWIDTFRESPQDIAAWEDAPVVAGHSYSVGPRSIVTLISQRSTKL
jgi:glycogen operon protein